jgi:hypothetical protein
MQLSIDLDPAPRDLRLRTARKLGAAAGEAAEQANDPTFGERAYAFIVRYVREHGPVAGEDVTLAAKAAGIRPVKDDRAFGPAYARAIRDGSIRVVGTCARVRGNGTAGGRVYGSGV